MNISNAWGYGAVVFVNKMAWQGFVILDPDSETVRAAVKTALANAALVESKTTPPEGTLSAALVECMERGSEFGVGVFASALSKTIHQRFWVVDVLDSDGQGVVPGIVITRYSVLQAKTPEAAREEIDRRVLPLRMGQLLQDLTKPSSTKVDP